MKIRKNKVQEKHWSDIKQSVGRKPVTFGALRRKVLMSAKFCTLLCSVCALFGVLVSGYLYIQGNPMKVNLSGSTHSIKAIQFNTDGVLSAKWFSQIHAIKKGQTLMEVDIFALKQKLESFGQIREAQVDRIFPATLRVQINEVEPVFRVRVPSSVQKYRDMLVSKDGEIFEGFDYPSITMKQLPFIVPSSISKDDTGFKPVEEVKQLYPLVKLAKSFYPKIFSTWKVISYKNIGSGSLGIGGFVYVRSSLVDKIIFRPKEYEMQMDRLSLALRTTLESGIKHLGVVDVSLDSTAVLQLASR